MEDTNGKYMENTWQFSRTNSKAFRTIRKTVRDTTRDVSRGDMLTVRWYEIPVFIPN